MLKKIRRENDIHAGFLERSTDGTKDRFAKVFSVFYNYIDKTLLDESSSFESLSNVINSLINHLLICQILFNVIIITVLLILLIL